MRETYCAYESCIFMGKVRAKSWCHSVNHFHIVWSIFTSIQIFSLIHCYHLSTIPATILSWPYFNTLAALFNRSDLVAILWLAATLARINKRKWSLKKEKIKQNLNAIAEAFSLKKPVYIQGSPALCQPFFFFINHTCKLFWHSNLNEPQRKNFVLIIIMISEVDIQLSSELFELLIQISSLFMHVTNFKITFTNLNSKFCIYYLKSWYFLNIWVSNFLEESSSAICASSPYNLGMKNWNQEVRSGVSYYTTFHKT